LIFLARCRTPNKRTSNAWKICEVWGGSVITRIPCRANLLNTSSEQYAQLSQNSSAGFLRNLEGCGLTQQRGSVPDPHISQRLVCHVRGWHNLDSEIDSVLHVMFENPSRLRQDTNNMHFPQPSCSGSRSDSKFADLSGNGELPLALQQK
jgi:hypothetical protein